MFGRGALIQLRACQSICLTLRAGGAMKAAVLGHKATICPLSGRAGRPAHHHTHRNPPATAWKEPQREWTRWANPTECTDTRCQRCQARLKTEPSFHSDALSARFVMMRCADVNRPYNRNIISLIQCSSNAKCQVFPQDNFHFYAPTCTE